MSGVQNQLKKLGEISFLTFYVYPSTFLEWTGEKNKVTESGKQDGRYEYWSENVISNEACFIRQKYSLLGKPSCL